MKGVTEYIRGVIFFRKLSQIDKSWNEFLFKNTLVPDAV